MDACTIIAKNYVAHARVLARSLAAQHPDARVHALVVDDFDGFLSPDDEPFAVLTPAQLGIEPFERMAALYDVVELCTALKPWLLRHVLARSTDGAAVFLDPDMRVYAPLDELFALVREHGLVLCPHSIDPLPRDGRRPDEQHILMAGAYNLGLIGLGAGDFSEELLRWWSERLETDCIVDPARGLFVDQRWIDLVPGMAPSFHVLRDRGLNVAYWNLTSRPIGRDGGDVLMAGDAPLRVFHFSGFDRDTPLALSRYQDRISVYEHAELAQLCLDYARELREQGADEATAWPYTFASLPSGLKLTPDIRRVYGELLAAGELERSIFTSDGEAALVDRLNAPAAARFGGAHGVTRYLAYLHTHHAHLWRAFPDLVAEDGPRYLHWARTDSRGEVPAPLCPPAPKAQPASRPAAPAAARRPFGVNVAGYLTAELGVGEVARQAIAGLDAGGVPVLPLAIPAPDSRHEHPFAQRGLWQGGYPINLVCVNPEGLPAFAHEVGPAFFDGRDTIGWWWWEVAPLPEQHLGALRHVDELWAGSRFVAEMLSAVATVPVTRVPVPVTVPGAPRPEPERFGLPPGFAFLFSYDYGSVLARKNPLGAIDAFLRAFPQAGEAVLVLKSINAERCRDDHARVCRAARGQPHIVVLDEYLEPVDTDRLIASCDCYLSLHRSEGFGMAMAKAMFLGRPVIATGYSGNLDFMSPENSWLVDYRLTAVGPDAAPYAPDGRWADPDLEHAAALMREVAADPEATRQRAARGARDIRRTHSPAAVGARMAGLLRAIAARLPEPRCGWEDPPALTSLRTADALLQTGPRPAPRAGARPVRSSLRRLVLRAMKPYSAYQRQVDRALIDAIEALAAEIRELTHRGYGAEALALHGLRDVERRLRGLVEPALAAHADRADELARAVAELEAARSAEPPGSDDGRA